MIVDVYRNLHTGTWSVRAASGPDRGKVLYHPREVALTDARFVVGEKARDTVRATCSKSVHAVVRGTLLDSPAKPSMRGAQTVKVGYNPYLFDTFVTLPEMLPVLTARWVHFPAEATAIVAGVAPDDVASRPVTIPRSRSERMAWCKTPAATRKRLLAEGAKEPRPNPAARRAVLRLLRSGEWNG